MNCARRDCGHSEDMHSPAEHMNQLPGKCWACDCPQFTVSMNGEAGGTMREEGEVEAKLDPEWKEGVATARARSEADELAK